MTAIEILLDRPAGQAIGWALLHFVWQGALIGVVAAAALRLLRNSAADVRYVVAAIALSLMATMPAVTAIQVWRAGAVGEPIGFTSDPSSATGDPAHGLLPPLVEPLAPESAPLAPLPSPSSFGRWLPFVVIGWMAGVVLLALRLIGGWFWIQRLKSHDAVLAGQQLQAVIDRLQRRLHIERPVRLLQAPGVDVPTVIGWLKPVVLLPVSALSGLTPLQVEAILAHELAHIRRHDYLVNLLQALVETLLFYHPAVWWLSRRIRIEREHCCDDLAVNLCGDPVVYARALADLEELRGAGARLALAATGGGRLLHRVRRLLATPARHDGRGPAWLAAVSAVLLMVGIVGSATIRHPFVAVTAAAEPADDATLLRAVPVLLHSVQNLSLPPLQVVESLFWPQVMPPLPPAPPQRPAAPMPSPPPPPPPPSSMPADAPLPPAPPDATAPVPLPPAPPPAAFAPLPPIPSTPGVLPSGDAPPAPPAPPDAAWPPVPPPPLPPSGASIVFDGMRQESSGTFSWSHNGDKIEVKYRGTFEINDDDTDIVKMSPGAYVRLSDGAWLRGRSVEFSADAAGNITRKFFIGSSERPFEPEGRQWLAQTLPRFVRMSGFAAKARVARILRTGGVSAVFAEISRIDSSYGKKTYFSELLKATALNASDARRLLEQASREITSDYELATLLMEGADKLLLDDATRKAYFDAARTIDSDYEMKRVYTSALKRGTVSPALLAGILDAARSIGSDYEAATLLIEIAQHYDIEGQVRAPFFASVDRLGSGYERGRVLQTLLRRKPLSDETLVAVLTSAGSMSGHEASQVLQAAARSQDISGAARDAYMKAADRLSNYEQDQALAALARNERKR